MAKLLDKQFLLLSVQNLELKLEKYIKENSHKKLETEHKMLKKTRELYKELQTKGKVLHLWEFEL